MIGKRAGIDLHKLDQVIRNASGMSSGYAGMASKAFKGEFAATFALDLAHKDVRLALEMADELGVPGLIAPQVMNLMRMARGDEAPEASSGHQEPEPETRAAWEALGIELAVVVAYGHILPRWMLASLPLGAWNLHFSLLPRWRG